MSAENRKKENEEYLKNENVQRCLGMISRSEGTNGNYDVMVFGTVISSPNFPQLIGKKDVRIPSYERYPNILVAVNSKLKSSAAGKYQILRATYASSAASMNIRDFSPHSQDLLAVELIRNRGAIPFILKGDIEGALTKTTLNKEWASLSGAGYGQHENKLKDLIAWFHSNLYLPSVSDIEKAGVSVLPIIAVGLVIYLLI